MAINFHDLLKQLELADPELAATVIDGLENKKSHASLQVISMLVDETIHGLSQEIAFGQAIANGFVELIGSVNKGDIYIYRAMIRNASIKGPTFGRILAIALVPVLKHGNSNTLDSFLHAVDIMLGKGIYLLNNTLDALSSLLNSDCLESASVYLDLLCETYSRDISYNRSKQLAYLLPKAILSFQKSKRAWQTKQLQRVIKVEPDLAAYLLDGMDKGLYLLSKKALEDFVLTGLNKYKKNRKLGEKFLSLESKAGIDTCTGMQVTVPISQVGAQLARYIRARTGLPISIQPISMISKSFLTKDTRECFACSDGKCIYLPDEISYFDDRQKNINLYKCLVRLESGYYEFNTFGFDIEKFAERNKKFKLFENNNQKGSSDLEKFFSSFPIKALSSDLFTIFEHGRLQNLFSRVYPGLVRQVLPLVREDCKRVFHKKSISEAVFLLYVWLVAGISPDELTGRKNTITPRLAGFIDLFLKKINKNNSVETSAELVVKTYKPVYDLLAEINNEQQVNKNYVQITTPFGRRILPDLFFSAYHNFEKLSEKIKVKLKEKGFKVYKSDIRTHLVANNGKLSLDEIRDIILHSDKKFDSAEFRHQSKPLELSGLNLEKIFESTGMEYISPVGARVSGPVSRYREWNCNLDDYLQDYVRVQDRTMPCRENDFFNKTLERYSGLVKMMRYSFELLKPEGLTILRQWIEGDEFDYRALFDFAMDKKAGLIPSDRLYIKRIKQQRDVAVSLLVDLSRSTSNTVFNSKTTVLDVEKEAIVLFCKALEVVGDSFSIAGFSGTGRLGVDYFHIKDFNEDMGPAVEQRINAMAPQRNTRMGAAIRHATSRLENISSRVRLLFIIGDGFPNDTGYKQKYAIEDTRRALFEAQSKNIYAKAITVNIADDPKLDDLYGNVHHNIISDVRELPAKLLRIYSLLTR